MTTKQGLIECEKNHTAILYKKNGVGCPVCIFLNKFEETHTALSKELREKENNIKAAWFHKQNVNGLIQGHIRVTKKLVDRNKNNMFYSGMLDALKRLDNDFQKL